MHTASVQPSAAQLARRAASARRRDSLLSSRRCSVSLSAWQEARDAASGQTYYWHSETRETRWHAPHPAPSASPSASPGAQPSGESNEALLQLFLDYILTPQAKFDYPAPSAPFLELVEQHREALYERPDCFYLYVCQLAETEPAGGPAIARSAGAAPLEAPAPMRAQSAGASAISMFNEEGMRWNTVVSLTRKEALESIRARLSNPALRDANPAF
jgi:WW domain